MTVSTIELLLRCFMAFLSSVWTSMTGVSGGPLLISVMPGIVPTAAIVPVHGPVPLAGNVSRKSFSVRDVVSPIFWPFVAALSDARRDRQAAGPVSLAGYAGVT